MLLLQNHTVTGIGGIGLYDFTKRKSATRLYIYILSVQLCTIFSLGHEGQRRHVTGIRNAHNMYFLDTNNNLSFLM